MKHLLSLLWLLALLTANQGALSSTRVSGRVLGLDGAPPRRGNVLIGRMVDGGVVTNFFFGKSLARTEIEKDGKFELIVPKAGQYKLVITAVDLEFLSIPLAISDTDKAIALTAQLAPLEVEPDAEIYLLGSWNHFSLMHGTKMSKAADGTFHYEGRSDAGTVSYLIHPSLRPQIRIQVINGTMADFLVPDGEWAYAHILPLADAMEKHERYLGATVVYRALLESILARALSKHYYHGVRYLRKLDQLSRRIDRWGGRGFEDIVAGAARYVEPPFLERASARWPRKSDRSCLLRP